MEYDYVIVGGGPTGLTLALYLAGIGKNCLLVDKNSSLGGCHRVTRTPSGEFTEHGPRIYSSAYVNVNKILNMINTSWDETFTPYRFNIADIEGTTFSSLSLREKFLFSLEFFKLFFNIEKRNVSVGEFMDRNSFSSSAKDYIDRICRLTDGAGSDRYTLFQFLQLLNQNFFEKLYQPKAPNDQHLFFLWEKKLLELGVTILKDTKVLTIGEKIIYTDKGQYTSEKILVCVPPKPFFSLLTQSPNLVSPSSFESVKSLSKNNTYIIDIPITFHWKEKLHLPKVWGFPRDDWAVAFIILSDYMKPEENYSTVISTCITRVNSKSSKTGKTAIDCSEQEMKDEVFRQLKISFPNLPTYDRAFLHQTTFSEEDTAFVETAKGNFIDMKLTENVYYIGTQNGNSFYSFTSMESAVTNALFALRKLESKLEHVRIRRKFSLIEVLRLLLFIIILVILLIMIKRNN